MPVTEHTINDALAEALKGTRHAWYANGVVSSENTGMLRGSNRRPDILISEANVSPVVIETEVLPAINVEAEARERLGERVRTTGRLILSSMAVRMPLRLRSARSGVALKHEIEVADDIEMALFTGSDFASALRFPTRGWVLGNVADLSILAQSAGVPPEVIEAAATQLIEGVSESAGLIEEMANSHPSSIHKISEALHQEDGSQTRRMAMTILANAFVFHESLAGGPGGLADVKTIEELRGPDGDLSKAEVLTEWRKILEINYWPIFDIARRILTVIPTAESRVLLERLVETANKLLENRLMRSHDLTGAVFQRLIADRKFLAAFYTTPASAALLAGLAIRPDKTPANGSWANTDDVKKLRIADFACGTGTLLSTAYQRMGQLQELAGGNAEALHPDMMAFTLTGCDVLPAAAHLTASMLSGAHPTVKYERSSILTVAYGKQPDGEISLGSLDLLDPQGRLGDLAITAKFVEGLGETEKDTWSNLSHASFDLVIMNPPYTRSTGHEGKQIAVPQPMFAAFGSNKEAQKLMAAATKKLSQGTSAHGNAGEASIFLVLGHRKLKPGGMLALVMPLSLLSGDAWEHSRTLLTKSYSDLLVVSIAGAKDLDASFSADTGSGECLLVGRKTPQKVRRATFVVLNEKPSYPMVGAESARQIRRLVNGAKINRLEDGPIGGTPIVFGSDTIGHVLDSPLPDAGGWYLSRIADLSLAQTAFHLANGRIWLPTMRESEACAIPMTAVQAIGEVGPHHRDIEASPAKTIRGPFKIVEAKAGAASTYPVLWSHDAERERTMQFDADCEGAPLQASTAKDRAIIEEKVSAIWSTASHSHFNRDFRFNSQSTSMQFTPRKAIGGRAWLSISLESPAQEKALVLWGNTTFGMFMYWWRANKQQSGRGSIAVRALEAMPILDVTELSAARLARAVKIFDKNCDRQLLPFNEIDRDPVRHELDGLFAKEVLNLDSSITADGGPLETLRRKLALEPSIHGDKKSRAELQDDDDDD